MYVNIKEYVPFYGYPDDEYIGDVVINGDAVLTKQ